MPHRELDKPDTTAARDHVDEGVVRGLMGYNVKRAYLVLHSAARQAAAEFDLRIPTFSCLSVIVRNPGISPSALAELLKIERSNLVVMVDELETRELVSRTQMKSDRRRFELTATVRGRRLHDKAVEAIAAAEAACLTALEDEEQRLLLTLLNRIEGSMAD